MKIETAAELLYGWSPEKVKTVMDKNLLSETDEMLTFNGMKIPVTVRVYGEIHTDDPYSPSGRVENMRVTINGSEVNLGERIENEIAGIILSE